MTHESLERLQLSWMTLKEVDSERGPNRVWCRLNARPLGEVLDRPPDDAGVAVAGSPLLTNHRDDVRVRLTANHAGLNREAQKLGELRRKGLCDGLAALLPEPERSRIEIKVAPPQV